MRKKKNKPVNVGELCMQMHRLRVIYQRGAGSFRRRAFALSSNVDSVIPA